MLCGYPPFTGISDEQILENILKGEYDFDDEIWDEISDEAKDLIENLIESLSVYFFSSHIHT
jgi:serine/threonine protein kinase